MAYDHVWEPNGVYMSISGNTSGAEINEAIDHIRRSPDLSKLSYVIADYSDVVTFQVTGYDTLLIAGYDYWISKTTQKLKIALVGTRPDVVNIFGIYMNAIVIKDTFDVQVFQDLEPARLWVSGMYGLVSAKG